VRDLKRQFFVYALVLSTFQVSFSMDGGERLQPEWIDKTALNRPLPDESEYVFDDGVDNVFMCGVCGLCVSLEGNDVLVVDSARHLFHRACFDQLELDANARELEEVTVQFFDKQSSLAVFTLVLGSCVLMTGSVVVDAFVGLKDGAVWVYKSIPRPSGFFPSDYLKDPSHNYYETDMDYEPDEDEG